jgi:endonuclease/exonuclease/phosphatase (EEP) superfamily protein YafD
MNALAGRSLPRPPRAGAAIVAAVVAAVIALGLGCVHPSLEPTILTADQARTAELPAEFELLSWNVYKQRRPRFEDELLRFSAGVELLLLQEATEEAPLWPPQAGQRAWTLVVAFELGRERKASGVATGTTATPVRERALLSPVREPLTRTPKSALLTWIELEHHDAALLLVNLHGINFRRAAALEAQLREIGEAIAGHLGPLLVAGDFNTWSPRRRAVVSEFAERHGLESPFAALPGRRLTDIYLRGLQVRAVEILPSRSSDHDALRVDLALPD